MSARDDYPMLAKLAERDRHMPWPEAASEVDRALDEIDRLRAELSFANDCLTKASGYLANEPSRRCWCGR